MQRVHIIGIGGIGVSALARHYLKQGWQVSGSEITRGKNSEQLAREGARVVYEQSVQNITTGIDLVVYSDGVPEGTPGWDECEAARRAGLETLSYFEALSRVANPYYLIAVSGTHGKTTTTAMLADILEEASFDPTVFVGSLRVASGSNYRPGQGKYCVVEADEYLRHFLHFTPRLLVITNIDLDHPDYFVDLADVQRAFLELVAKVPADGFIVADTNHSHVTPVLKKATATVVDYRQAVNVARPLSQPGLHNRYNVAAAEVAARALGVSQPAIDTALEHFAGTARRFEYKGSVHNAPVYDDYAHNPQKVAAAIAGAREAHPNKKLTVVFEPHTYSRTKTLFAEFVDALANADRVILLPIFAAREVSDGSVSSEQLRVALAKQSVAVTLLHTVQAAALAVRQTASSEDVILCVGAGSGITKVSELITA